MSSIGGIGGSSNAWTAPSSGRTAPTSPAFTTSDIAAAKDISAPSDLGLDRHGSSVSEMDFDDEEGISSEEMFESLASEGKPLPSTMDFAQARGMEPVATSVTVITQAVYASPEENEQGPGKNKLHESV